MCGNSFLINKKKVEEVLKIQQTDDDDELTRADEMTTIYKLHCMPSDIHDDDDDDDVKME